MTEAEKLIALKADVAPNKTVWTDGEDSMLTGKLADAASLILETMYPFGTDIVVVPVRYERKQLAIAVVLFNKRGAEGESAHSANGISRTYEGMGALLRGIIPFVGSPS